MAVFFVDRLFLGHYSSEALSCMQIAGPLTWSLYSVLTAYRVGSIATVSRAAGADDHEALREQTAASLLLALGAGLLSLILLPLLPQILALYTAPPAAISGAYGYLSVCIAALPAFCFGVTGTAVMSARGDTRTPFLVGIVKNLINIVLDLVLIFGLAGFPELGLRGAAIATAASWVFEGCVLTVLLCYGSQRIFNGLGGLRRLAFVRIFGAVRRILVVSAPALAERLVFQSGFLIFAALITKLGKEAMAANQAAISVEALSFTSSDAIGLAGAAVVGQRLGAGRPEEARQAAYAALRFALVLLSAAALFYGLAAGWLASLFVSEPGIAGLATTVLIICAFEQPGLAVSDVLSQALRGAGDTRSPLIVALLSVWSVRVFGTWFVTGPLGYGLPAVWWVTTFDWTLRAGIFWWIFERGRWASLRV